ncbi:WD domain repeat-containing protein 55 [Dimargaris verticillata]|uniref:WD repeat-containing protein JIP5 n=1 Tax=Dimargaris verticillata TaxID=2761393 RepID=A0A9W8BC56_9FUNG|nr:WD domain repeat-containing protein 55 [Dimargaris verticillata]
MEYQGTTHRVGVIPLRHAVEDMAYHPQEPLLMAGLVTGEVHCFRTTPRSADTDNGVVVEHDCVSTTRPHKKAIRSVDFLTNNRFHGAKDAGRSESSHCQLVTASRDKSWSLMSVTPTGAEVVHRYENAHPEPLSKIRALSTTNMVATGDDSGVIRIWDVRTNKQVQEYTHHFDYIGDMFFVPEKRRLLTAGTDGLLAVLDLRHSKPVALSEEQDDELLSVMPVKNNQKVVVGTQTGVLGIFSWGNWGDVTDRFPGHPESVDTLCRVNDDTLLTGSSDGIIRAISIQPNSLVGVVGSHSSYPIERLDFSPDFDYLASLSHDNEVKLWSVKHLFEAVSDDDDTGNGDGDGNGNSSGNKTNDSNADTPLLPTSEKDPAPLTPTQEALRQRERREQAEAQLEQIDLDDEDKVEVRRRLAIAIGTKKKPPPIIVNVLTKRIVLEIKSEKLRALNAVAKAEKANVTSVPVAEPAEITSPSPALAADVQPNSHPTDVTDEVTAQPADQASSSNTAPGDGDSGDDDNSTPKSKRKRAHKPVRLKKALKGQANAQLRKKSNFFAGLS